MKVTRGPWFGLFARQLIKDVCQHILLSVLAGLLLYIAIDTVETGNMAKNAEDAWDVLRLELVTLPVVFQQFASMAIVIGTATALSSLVRRGEVIAMFSAGGPPALLLRPALLAGALWALTYAGVTEWVAPWAHAQVSQLRRTLGIGSTRTAGMRGSRNWFTGQDRIFRVGDMLHADGKALADVLILDVKEGRLVERWDVARLTWQAGVWTAHDVVQRRWPTPDTLETHRVAALGIDLAETPEDFVRSVGTPERLAFSALAEAVRARERLGQPVEVHTVELYRRLTQPLTLLLALLCSAGLVLKLGGRRPTVAAALGIGALVGFALWLTDELALAFASTSALSPVVAALLPPVLTGAAAAWLWVTAYRRGITD